MVRNRKPRQVWEIRFKETQGRGSPRIEWEEHVWKIVSKKREDLPGGEGQENFLQLQPNT
jgi:hypothetical protein